MTFHVHWTAWGIGWTKHRVTILDQPAYTKLLIWFGPFSLFF